MSRALWRWVINAVALYVAARVVTGIELTGDWVSLALIALVFGVVNALLGPILKLLSCPLILLSLGVFTIVINAALLLLTSYLSEALNLGFHVSGFGPAFLGALLISVVSFILNVFLRDSDRHERRKK
ncbi:MAG: phage holin family protein [Chloroflexi bacterium]|nr:phage holin family protein [Chloroflexota bacterium]